LETRRSTTGYIYLLAGGAVSWEARLQPTVAASSTEAEYMAAFSAVQDAVHMRSLLADLGAKQGSPTLIYEDNRGAMALANNTGWHKRTKHIDVKYHFLRERVATGEVKLEYVKTGDQVADMLTKALPAPALRQHRAIALGK
jgi:hypothetical protein